MTFALYWAANTWADSDTTDPLSYGNNYNTDPEALYHRILYKGLLFPFWISDGIKEGEL